MTEQYDALKSKIILKNATTPVTVNGDDYTIATAIVRKQRAEQVLGLVVTMHSQQEVAVRKVNRGNEEVRTRLSEHLRGLFGEKADGTKAAEVEEATEAFVKRWGWSIVNPNGQVFEDYIVTLNDDAQDFLRDVDTQLAIANATTFIDVTLDE